MNNNRLLSALCLSLLSQSPSAVHAAWGDRESCKPTFQVPNTLVPGEIRKVLVYGSDENPDKVLLIAPVGSNNFKSLPVGFEGQSGSIAKWKNGRFTMLANYTTNSGYELYNNTQKILVLDCN